MRELMLGGWRKWTAADQAQAASKEWIRLAVAIVALAAVVLCAQTGWQVVQELRRIRLSELRKVLDVLTVGDVVLCLLGYGLGKELLRAVVRRAS